MDKRLDWEISRTQIIDNKNTYLDGGEIFMTICPPQGYVIWAITDIEGYQADVVIYGYGDSEEEAKANLQANMNKFTSLIYG